MSQLYDLTKIIRELKKENSWDDDEAARNLLKITNVLDWDLFYPALSDENMDWDIREEKEYEIAISYVTDDKR